MPRQVASIVRGSRRHESRGARMFESNFPPDKQSGGYTELWNAFKRITATLHILAAVCVLICIEVLVSSVTYEQAHLPFR